MSTDTIVLLAIAMMNLIAGYLTYKAHQAILIVERATNSMKDALVASTARASYSAGHEAASLEGTDKATQLAKAVAEAARVLAAMGAQATLGRRDYNEARNKEPPRETQAKG